MSRNIDPDKTLMPEFSTAQPHLPIEKPIAQYIRQSTMGQVKENIQSKIQQDEMLRKRLVKYGWKDTDEYIIKIDKDLGISGQKKQDIREGLNELYHLIKSGQVKAIAAYDASRFWRDRTHVWYNDFIQLLIQYDVCVVMFNQVYFPSRDADMEALREEFKQAAYYLNHIYNKVNPAKMQAIELGESYGGGAVPIGFTVTGTKGNRHYIPYEPHAKLVRWLYKRYRELGGNLPRLARECQNTGFSFPAFTDMDKIPHVALPFVNGCYRATSRDGLASMLTNPAYIGYYIFNGVLISKTAHDAIVPLDDFMYAYARLSPIHLDGTPNIERPHNDRHYGVSAQGLLEGLLYNGKNTCYVMARTQSYVARSHADTWKKTSAQTELVIRVDTLDKAVSRAIIDMLVALKQQQRKGLQTDLHAQIDALQQRKASEAETLASQLKGVENSIKGWELDKQSARDTQNKRALDDANRELNTLYAAKDDLENQIKALDTETDELTETKTLLKEAFHMWEQWRFDTKKRFINLVIQHIDITEASPHVFRITIDLKAPINGYVVGHIYRLKGAKMQWTEEENDILTHVYPHADRLEVLKALPERSWESIIKQASFKGIARFTRLNTSDMVDTIAYADYTYQQTALDKQEFVSLKQGGIMWNLTHMGIGDAWIEGISEDIDAQEQTGGANQRQHETLFRQ